MEILFSHCLRFRKWEDPRMTLTSKSAGEIQMLTNHFLLPIGFRHSRSCYYDYGIVFRNEPNMTCDTSSYSLHSASQKASFLQVLNAHIQV